MHKNQYLSTLRTCEKNHRKFGKELNLEKSYQDGIIDAIEIVAKWKNIGMHPSIINGILENLNNLLGSPENSNQLKLSDITNDQNKSQENND